MAIDWDNIEKKAKQLDAADAARAARNRTNGSQKKTASTTPAIANVKLSSPLLPSPIPSKSTQDRLTTSLQTKLSTPVLDAAQSQKTSAQKMSELGINPNATPNLIPEIQRIASGGSTVKPVSNPTTLERTANTVSGAVKGWAGQALNAIDVMGKNPLNPLTYGLGAYNRLVAPKAVELTKTWADKLVESGAQNMTEAKRGASGAGKLAVDVGAGALQLAGDVVVGAATGGGALVPMALRSFGGAAKEAEDNGASLGEQIAYGTLQAGSSVLTEKLSNAGNVLTKAFGKGALDDVLQNATTKAINKFVKSEIGQAVAQRISTGVIAGLGEGFEEVVQDALTPIFQKITYDPNAKLDAEGMIYDGLVGAILGGALGGIGGANVQTQTAGNNVRNDVQNDVKNVLTDVQNAPGTQNIAQDAPQSPTIDESAKDVKLPAETENALKTQNTTLPQGTGAMSNPFVPKQEISKVFTNTFQKTDALTDEQRAQMKPENYAYDVRSHAQNEAAAQQRIDVDYEGEIADLYNKQEWTDEDVFTSKKILDKISADAEQSGDYTELNKWTKAIQERGTRGGQTVEAFKAFQKTPEGAVIKAQQVVAEAEKKLTTKKELGKDVDSKKGRKIKADADSAKKAVKESANESANATDPANVAVEWWMRDTAKKLSDRIDGNAKNKSAKTQATMQTILNDLVRITKGAASQGESAKASKTVATDTLRNYWANPEQYQAAVERAQRYINEKYANDPEALAAFNDWLSGSGINTWQLLGRSLQENGVKFNDILMSSWQDKAKLLDNVTKAIIADSDLTESEARQAAQAISDKFYDELATRAQKKVEQLLKPSTPKQQKTMYQKINEFINSGVFDDSAIVDLVRSKYGIPTLTTADVQKIYELNKLAQETENDYQQRVYLNRAARVIADKLPVTGKEKVLAIRRIAMLLNPKTLISRNAGGNVIFGLLEDIKDAPATLIDIAVSKKTGQRTTSFNPLATAKAEFLGAKKGITEWGKDIVKGVDTSPTQHEMPQAPALKSKVGKAAESALDKLLQLGDRPFFEAAKAKRLDELKRLGLDYTSEDAIAEANAYALERVFQNDSGLAKKAMELRDSLGVIGDIAIPFAQTPANIFDKLADYSPFGFVRAIKKAGTIQDSAWSQKQFVDTLSRAMTGTGIIAFAFFAAKNGLITGGEDKDEDEGLTYLNKVSGWQPYSIRVGDKSYTYDWSTVVGALLSLGADMAQSESGGETLMAILSNGAKAGINTMFNQSYMDGVAELFGKSSGGRQDIASGLEALLVGLPASFTPTAFQQIAKIIDPIARDTYDTDPLKRAWNKVKAKLPYLSQTLPAKIGADGQEMTNFQGSKLSNIFESMLSPRYIGEMRKTAIDNEMLRLYNATGNNSVLPNWSEYTSKGDLSITGNDGTKYTMTMKEWEQYQKTRGQYAYKELNKVINGTAYKSMTDEQKADVLSRLMGYANDKAKREYLTEKGVSYDSSAYGKVYEAEQQGISPSDYFVYQAELDEIDENGSPSQLEKTKAIEATSLTQAQKGKLWQIQNADANPNKNPYTGTLAQQGLAPDKNIEIMDAHDTIEDTVESNYTKQDGGPSTDSVAASYFKHWLYRQGYNDTQVTAIMDMYKYWYNIPANPTKKSEAYVAANPMP